jgi:hypothetical protein
MRREYIYPHRSVRSFPLSWVRLSAALAVAALLSGAVFYSGTWLLTLHSRITVFILEQTGIPIDSPASIEVFPHFGLTTGVAVPFAEPRSRPWYTAVIFAACLGVMVVVHRKVALARNFLIFLAILLFAAAAVIVINPSFHFDSAMYQQIWLRGEVLVWLILPWVAAFLFILTIPSWVPGLAWTLLMECYAVVWSAVRLAFCLGVLHFTGILFLPLLWFCLGLLFDVVYVLLFYTLALNWTIVRVAGRRRP